MASADEIRQQIAKLQADLKTAEEADARAAMAGNAKRAIAMLAAMKAAFKGVEDLFPGTFNKETWAAAFGSTSWPRFDKLRKAADLSETETATARQAGEAAIGKL